MAHLPLLRYTTSFIQGRDLVYGTHEEVEYNIAKQRYKVSSEREGYNIPYSSEIKCVDYRLKEECIPQLLGDLGVINLNPKTNTMTLWKIFFTPRHNKEATLGLSLRVAQYMFKWINRKYTVSLLLIILVYFNMLSLFLCVCIIVLLLMNPFQPVDVNIKQTQLRSAHCLHFCIGYLKDMTDSYEFIYGREKMKDAL